MSCGGPWDGVKTVQISVIDGANSEICLYLDIKLYNPVLM